ncbi:tRNA adenosine(34) deaminase TadA [Tautonia sociabilis]|uniref:tRNA-specific adenosine deaminase n=1 Tax=Tautonia sociabilis TaxID=2080755 RepID=A0A432MGT7_9BACT|nr:tRNA adenosine(34) deaminase TadA [Tautonia sociabilis]RUL86139.1 nucleoside deaminase [Tautonia sociabilis]
MHRALDLAREAFRLGEVPVGCVITLEDRIIAEAFNQRELLSDPTAHAERLAISSAGRSLGTWRLDGCRLYVTLEPCPMCAGSIVLARIPLIVYGASDPKAGACDSLYRLTRDRRLNHQARTQGGVLSEECGELLSRFFQHRRHDSLSPPAGRSA